MAAALRQNQYYTPEEYLALEREAEFKSEYFEGQIYAMAGGSPPHSLISNNVGAVLGSQLWDSSCNVYNSELKIRTLSLKLFSYPDVTVVCGELEFHDSTSDVVTNSKVIVEVLSPSTETFDLIGKFEAYQKLETLTDYLLVAQDRPRIEHYSRQNGNQWLLTLAEGLTSEIFLDSIGCTLTLSKVYKGVVFPLKMHVEDETKR